MRDTQEEDCLFLLLNITLEYCKHTHNLGSVYRRVISRGKAKFQRLFVCNKWNKLYLSASNACLTDQFWDLKALKPIWTAFLCSFTVLLIQITVFSAESTCTGTHGHHAVLTSCEYLRKHLKSGINKCKN